MTPADWSAIALSVRVAVAATALALVPALVVARWLAQARSPLAAAVEVAVMLPLAVPPVVTGFALLLVLPRTLAFTYGAAVLAAAVVGFPLLVQTARAGFEAVDPTLVDLARTDGATRWQAFWRVVLPLAAPAVAAGAALHFARGLGEFGATIVVAGNIPGRTQTVPLALYARLNEVGGEAASVRLALAAVALTALSLVVHRWLLSRLSRPGRREV
ncbi:MAG: ABC transporter permease subunit [Bacteroidota bacterium]